MRKDQLGVAAPTSPHSQVNSAVFRFHGGKCALNSAAPEGPVTGEQPRSPAVVQPREETHSSGKIQTFPPNFSGEPRAKQKARAPRESVHSGELTHALVEAVQREDVSLWPDCETPANKNTQNLLTTAHTDVTELNLVTNGHRLDVLSVSGWFVMRSSECRDDNEHTKHLTTIPERSSGVQSSYSDQVFTNRIKKCWTVGVKKKEVTYFKIIPNYSLLTQDFGLDQGLF